MSTQEKSIPNPTDNEAIKALYIAGSMELKHIAVAYGLPYSTLKARSRRGRWAEYRKAHLARMFPDCKSAGEESSPHVSPSENRCIPEDTLPPDRTANVAAASWAERQMQQREIAFQKAHEGLCKAVVAPPRSWKDVEIVDRIARRASGLDEREESSMGVSFAFGFLNGNAI